MGTSNAYGVTFESLMNDVRNLITLHPSKSGTPGRPAGDSGPLLRSTVVLLHTAWENYVEQVAVEGLEFILASIGADHSRLHAPLQHKLAALKNPWALAGTGWVAEARNAVLGEAGRLNTPDVANTEKLLDLAVGFSGSLNSVSWKGMPTTTVVRNVDEFVHDIRGEIVHKGATPGPLNKDGVKTWINFFSHLVPALDEKVRGHLESVGGASPW